MLAVLSGVTDGFGAKAGSGFRGGGWWRVGEALCASGQRSRTPAHTLPGGSAGRRLPRSPGRPAWPPLASVSLRDHVPGWGYASDRAEGLGGLPPRCEEEEARGLRARSHRTGSPVSGRVARRAAVAASTSQMSVSVPCPVPRAPCPVPSAPCPVPRAPCPVPRACAPCPVSVPRAPCAVPRAPCPMPRAPCPVPHVCAGSSHTGRFCCPPARVVPWQWLRGEAVRFAGRQRKGQVSVLSDTCPAGTALCFPACLTCDVADGVKVGPAGLAAEAGADGEGTSVAQSGLAGAGDASGPVPRGRGESEGGEQSRDEEESLVCVKIQVHPVPW